MKDLTNIALLITLFIATGGFFYWILGFFLIIDWIKIVLAIIFTLILGLIFYKKNKKDKSIKF